MVEITDIEFSLLKEYLSRICGIDVPSEKRYLFRTRLGDFLTQENCRTFSELYNRLTTGIDMNLERRLIQAMTTHESSFFRDGHPFELLLQKLLPQTAARRIADAGWTACSRFRILSCGCSSGQEPYSIAMCVQEWLGAQDRFRPGDITILGIDISGRILNQAAKGLYTAAEIGKFLPARFKHRHFTRDEKEGLWRLDPELCQMVNFAELNLAENFGYLGKFDLVFCRNVIIYFSRELKRNIVHQLRDMLNPGGALILGASESLYMLSDEFRAVHDGPTTYYIPK